MSNRVSECACVSVLVVKQHTGILLTPLTPYETRMNARDQGSKHDWGVRGDVRKDLADYPLGASTGRRTPFTERQK